MDNSVAFELISQDDSWQVFDATAQRLLGMSAGQFVEKWDAGEYADADQIEVMQVAMLRPGGRE
jgi:hypothetical protein